MTPVTEGFAVCGQLSAKDIGQAAEDGVRLIVNNRPDGEEPGQPSAATLQTAAAAVGVSYLHLPIRGMPTVVQAQTMHEAVDAAGGPVVAFCRSGMRSVFTWALGEQTAGRRTRSEVASLARAAGYDLEPYLPR